jgi:hypothetical protein
VGKLLSATLEGDLELSALTLLLRSFKGDAECRIGDREGDLVAERIERDRDREGGERERGEMDLDGDRLRADLLRDRLGLRDALFRDPYPLSSFTRINDREKGFRNSESSSFLIAYFISS